MPVGQRRCSDVLEDGAVVVRGHRGPGGHLAVVRADRVLGEGGVLEDLAQVAEGVYCYDSIRGMGVVLLVMTKSEDDVGRFRCGKGSVVLHCLPEEWEAKTMTWAPSKGGS